MDDYKFYKCFITGYKGIRGVFKIHEHHYIRQQDYEKHREFFEREKIPQKTFYVWYEVHADIHSAMSDERFYDKWKIHRSVLLFRKRAYFENQTRQNQ